MGNLKKHLVERWMFFVPVGYHLVGMGGAQEQIFAEMRPH